MSKIFFKYRVVIITDILFLSMMSVMILHDGSLRDFFIGFSTSIALVIFGQSISTVKSQERAAYKYDK